MGEGFFYTYCNDTDDCCYVQGYKDGKRVRYAIGRMKNYSRMVDKSGHYVKFFGDKYKDCIERYKKFSEFTNTYYITVEDYNRYRYILNVSLSDTETWYSYDIVKRDSNDRVIEVTKGRFHFESPVIINTDCDKKTIDGKSLVELRFKIYDTLNVERWFKENNIDLYGVIDLNSKYMDDWQDRKDFKIDYDKIKIGFIDIETEMEHGQMDTVECPERINVITLKVLGDKIYTWCLGEFHTDDPNVEYVCCVDEKQLLRCFLDKWEELDLDVISDWNGMSFDIPYIVGRIKKLLKPESVSRLSPFGLVIARQKKNSFGKKYETFKIVGINHLDYMELYVNYSHTPQSSYSLNNICNYEIGKGKIDYSEYGSLHKLYLENFQKFVEYNIRDVTIIEELDAKLRMIHLAMSVAYMCRCCFEDVYSQIRIWDSYIYSNFKHKNLVIPPKKEISAEQRGTLMGGYVKLPKKAGVFSNIVSFDVNSLYPTIIRQLNLSPETMTDEVDEEFKKKYGWLRDENGEFLRDNEGNKIQDPDDLHHLKGFINCEVDCSKAKEKGMVYTCNGNFVKKDKQGFLPEMVGNLYNNRVEVKKKMKKSKQELELVIKELEKRGE